MTDATAVGSESRRPRTLAVVATVAALVRLLYLAEHARSPSFTVAVLDGRWFDLYARALAAGAPPAELATGFRPVLYSLLLAPLYDLLGAAGIVAVQILQHGAGVGTALLAALLARRVHRDERSALAAGLLYALAPVPVFLEGELLVESLFVLTAGALLLVLAPGETRGGPSPAPDELARAALAGVLLAVAAQLRPNVLLLFAALPVAVALRRSTARAAAAFALAALASTLVLALALAPAAAGFRLLPGAGAVNLYLGNERGADGLVPRQDFDVGHGDEYRDSVELFAREGHRRARPGATAPNARELDRYWIGRTLEEIRADPAGRLALLGRKCLVLLWNGEVPNNRSFGFAREESWMLRLLPVRFGLLLALALAGAALSTASAARFWTLAFASTHALGVVLFFVADRYRFPLALPAAVFAGGGVAGLGRLLGARRSRRAGRLLLLVAAGLALSFVDWTSARADLPGPARDLHFRSIARLETGDPSGAAADAELAAAAAPADPAIRTQLGLAALAAGDLDLAERALAEAAALAPGDPRARNALGVLAERRGRRGEARRRYDEALELAPEYAPARLNAAWLALLEGRDAEATVLSARLPGHADPPLQELVLRATLAERRGDRALAERLRGEARRRSPAAAAALERELRAPLSAPSTSRR